LHKNWRRLSYAFDMRSEPHARPIKALENLAYARGASVGVAAVEAFTVLRAIVRSGLFNTFASPPAHFPKVDLKPVVIRDRRANNQFYDRVVPNEI
jgi:hypothetical protein